MPRSTNLWVSWWHHPGLGGFTLHWPWWVTGYRGDGAQAICAAIRAEPEAGSFGASIAHEIVRSAYDRVPPTLDFRFVERRDDDWTPYHSRFQQDSWMPDWNEHVAEVVAARAEAYERAAKSPYSPLVKRLAHEMRERLRVAGTSPARFDGDGLPSAMDYVAAVKDVLDELRRLGWREPVEEGPRGGHLS